MSLSFVSINSVKLRIYVCFDKTLKIFFVQTFAEADRKFWESITDEWEVEKQKILNSLLSVGKEAMTFPVETEVFITLYCMFISKKVIKMSSNRMVNICRFVLDKQMCWCYTHLLIKIIMSLFLPY